MSIASVRTAITDSVQPAPLQIDIPVASIEIPANHRKHHPHAVQAMAENIDIHGLQQPIEAVRLAEGVDGHRLVFGSLRLQAVQLLGWGFIPAQVREADEFGSELALRLRSIFENMYRSQMTALDWSVAVSDWCEIYRAGQSPLSPGRKPATPRKETSLNFRLASSDEQLIEASSDFTASFSEAAQAFLDVSRAKIFRALRIASIPSLQRDRIALHPLAKSEGDLYTLGGMKDLERQAAVLDLIIAGKVSGVEEALMLLDGKTKIVLAKWEAMASEFSRLQENDQDRFFDLNESGVIRWQAKRGR